MWRTISRLRQSVGICANKSNNEYDSGHNLTSKQSTLIPKKNSVWVLWSKDQRKCSSSSGSRNNNGEERRDQRARQGGPYYQARHDWLDTFGWSGVLLLGWYICQPLCSRSIARNPAERYAYQRLAQSSPTEFPDLVNLVSSSILEPSVKYVLPTVQAVKSKIPSPAESVESIETAHKKVTRSLENFLGTECMQAGKHDKAFAHFTEAAQSDDVPALFNLAICYEMGLGTKQCFTKAADLYKRASALGHATAMYNLGVFHVHGWGGLEADENKARQLFIEAARLGQIDAKRALNSTVEKIPSESESDNEEYQFPFRDIEPKMNDLTKLWYEALNIKLDNFSSNKRNERLSSSGDSGVNDMFSSPFEFDVIRSTK